MIDNSQDPLPARVSEYVVDGNHDATPDEVLAAADLDESCRERIKHYLAVTRYTMFKNEIEDDTDGLRLNSIEWDDVADWDV